MTMTTPSTAASAATAYSATCSPPTSRTPAMATAVGTGNNASGAGIPPMRRVVIAVPDKITAVHVLRKSRLYYAPVGLAGYVDILRRRWIPLLVCILVGLGGGLYEGHHGPKIYQATSRVIVNSPASQVLSEAFAGAQLASSLPSTYAPLASSQVVAARVV